MSSLLYTNSDNLQLFNDLTDTFSTICDLIGQCNEVQQSTTFRDYSGRISSLKYKLEECKSICSSLLNSNHLYFDTWIRFNHHFNHSLPSHPSFQFQPLECYEDNSSQTTLSSFFNDLQQCPLDDECHSTQINQININ